MKPDAADAEAPVAAAEAKAPGVLVPFPFAKRPSTAKLSDRHQHMPQLFTTVGAPESSRLLLAW